MPVKKGLSKDAKIGITAASILTLGAVAALTVWGVKSKGNKEPEGTEPNIKGPNNEEQNIENKNIIVLNKHNEKEKNIVNAPKSNKIIGNEPKNIIIKSKINNGNKLGNIILEEKKIEEKIENKPKESTFDKELRIILKTPLKDIQVDKEIYVYEYVFKGETPKKAKLPWTLVKIFRAC